MIKNKLKTKGQSGFTIVELLIVIVVIGILAAITIVSYSGITARANSIKAQTNGANVQKVAEAYNADPLNTGYPSLVQLQGYSALTTSVAKIPSGVTLQSGIPSTSGLTVLQYTAKGTSGGCIGWWDFAAGTPVTKYIFVGDATSQATATTCV